MSSRNPKPAVDSICGKLYAFKGREYRATVACLMALARAGIELSDIQANLMNASAVVCYMLTRSNEEARKALTLPTEDLLTVAQNWASELTIEEMGLASAITIDLASRYSKSLTSYVSELGGSEKNQ